VLLSNISLFDFCCFSSASYIITVVLEHRFKLLSFSIYICCFLLVYLYITTTRRVQKRFSRWRPSAILNFKKQLFFWSRDCHRVHYLLWCIKFHQNRTIFHWYIMIWRFNDILDFRNLQLLSCGIWRHAVLLLRTKFRWNWPIGTWAMAKKRFSSWRPSAMFNSKNLTFWSRDCHRVLYLLLYTKLH